MEPTLSFEEFVSKCKSLATLRGKAFTQMQGKIPYQIFRYEDAALKLQYNTGSLSIVGKGVREHQVEVQELLLGQHNDKETVQHYGELYKRWVPAVLLALKGERAEEPVNLTNKDKTELLRTA